jgi:hypothetical protein
VVSPAGWASCDCSVPDGLESPDVVSPTEVMSAEGVMSPEGWASCDCAVPDGLDVQDVGSPVGEDGSSMRLSSSAGRRCSAGFASAGVVEESLVMAANTVDYFTTGYRLLKTRNPIAPVSRGLAVGHCNGFTSTADGVHAARVSTRCNSGGSMRQPREILRE